MFEGFRTEQVDTGDASIFVRHGGDGPPMLLLHGHPRTSATWHRVAPMLVRAGFSVVCPDLRGYGRSRGPRPTADHAAHCKRAVASDMADVMTALGHDRFHLAGHDRGGPVALRLTLDQPARVRTLAALDCLPLSEHLRRADARFATAWWHWFFLAQPDIPERVINADPDSWYDGDPDVMGRENYDEWRVVGLLVLAVDAEPGAVVLEHRSDDFGPAGGAAGLSSRGYCATGPEVTARHGVAARPWCTCSTSSGGWMISKSTPSRARYSGTCSSEGTPTWNRHV